MHGPEYLPARTMHLRLAGGLSVCVWLRHVVGGVSVPQLGIESVPPALESEPLGQQGSPWPQSAKKFCKCLFYAYGATNFPNT